MHSLVLPVRYDLLQGLASAGAHDTEGCPQRGGHESGGHGAETGLTGGDRETESQKSILV